MDVEVEIGRHALRTFVVQEGKLRSVVQPTYWDSGAMVAECLRQREIPVRVSMDALPSRTANGYFSYGVATRMIPSPCDDTPGEHCHCGLYGTVSLSPLIAQYGSHARRSIAVIAAEGPTRIGSRGLRTSAARIVAYWVHPRYDDHLKAYEATCPDATFYLSLEAMLKHYDIEAEPAALDMLTMLNYTDDYSLLPTLMSLSTRGQTATPTVSADTKKRWWKRLFGG